MVADGALRVHGDACEVLAPQHDATHAIRRLRRENHVKVGVDSTRAGEPPQEKSSAVQENKKCIPGAGGGWQRRMMLSILGLALSLQTK